MARKRGSRWKKSPKDNFRQWIEDENKNLSQKAEIISGEMANLIDWMQNQKFDILAVEKFPSEIQKSQEQLEKYEKSRATYLGIREWIDPESPIYLSIISWQEKVKSPPTPEAIQGLIQEIWALDKNRETMRLYIHALEMTEAIDLARESLLDWRATSTYELPMFPANSDRDKTISMTRELEANILSQGCTTQTFTLVEQRILDQWYNPNKSSITQQATWFDWSISDPPLYEIKHIFAWLYSLPWDNLQRNKLAVYNIGFPDPVLHDMVQQSIRSSKSFTKAGKLTDGVKFCLFYLFFTNLSNQDTQILMQWLQSKMVDIIKSAQSPKQIVDVLCEYMRSPLITGHEEFDELGETIQSMKKLYDDIDKMILFNIEGGEKILLDTKYFPRIKAFTLPVTIRNPLGNETKEDLERLMQKREVVESFRQKIQKGIREGKSLETSVTISVASIEKLKWINPSWVENNAMAGFIKKRSKEISLVKSIDLRWFERVGDKYMQNIWSNSWIKPTYHRGGSPLSLGVMKYPKSNTSKCNTEDVMQSLYSLIDLWFGWGEIMRVPWNSSTITVDKLCFEIINSVFDKKEKLERQFELLTHCIQLDEKSVLDTSLWKEIVQISKNIEEQDHDFWKKDINDLRRLATKLNRKEFADAILDMWFQRSHHTQRITEDFIKKKLKLLENFAITTKDIEEIHWIPQGRLFCLIWKDDVKKKVLEWKLKRNPNKSRTKAEYMKLKNIDLYNINWKPITHYLANDASMSEQLIDGYLEKLGDDFDLDKKYVVEDSSSASLEKNTSPQTPLLGGEELPVSLEWGEKKKKVQQTALHQSILAENIVVMRSLLKKIEWWKKEMHLYETLQCFRRDDGKWNIETTEYSYDMFGKSLVHMIAECFDDGKVWDMLWEVQQFLEKHEKKSHRKTLGFTGERVENNDDFVDLLKYINPETQLTWLQTLAEYGHIELVEELMRNYELDIWWWDEPEETILKIAWSRIASVEVLKWFDTQYEKWSDQGNEWRVSKLLAKQEKWKVNISLENEWYGVIQYPTYTAEKNQKINQVIVDKATNSILPRTDNISDMMQISWRVLQFGLIKEFIRSGNPKKLAYILAKWKYNPKAEYLIDQSKMIKDKNDEFLKIKLWDWSMEKCLELLNSPPQDIIKEWQEQIHVWQGSMRIMIKLLREADQAHIWRYEDNLDPETLEYVQEIVNQTTSSSK